MPRGLLLTESPNQERLFRRSLPYLREYGGRLAVACLVALLTATSMALVAPAIGYAVDRLVDRDGRGLAVATVAVVVLAVIRLACQMGTEALLPRAVELVIRRLRDKVVERLATAPLRFIEAHRSGDLLRRATAELADLAAFTRTRLTTMVTNAAYLLVMSVLLVLYSWQLAIVLAVAYVPTHLVLLRLADRISKPASAAEASTASDVAAHFRELLDIREQLQLHGGGEKWLGRLTGAARAQQRAVLWNQRGLNLVSAAQLVQAVALGALLVVGGLQVTGDATSLGTVVVFLVAARQMSGAITQISDLGSHAVAARVVLARVLNLLHRTRPRPTTGLPVPTPARGTLQIRDLTYAYVPGHDVVQHVSVTLPAGDRVGVYGETGSGKTTLAKLLSGLYTPSNGSITYAGIDLLHLEPAELRKRIVLVPQEVHLVTGTLLENLALIPTRPTRAEVEAGISSLELDMWVAGLPHGLDTDIGPRGQRLSAGERQLIGLVRAALVDAAVLVFDEATANLDLLTAERVESAIRQLAPDRTVIVIAHRQATVERLARPMQLRGGVLGPGRAQQY
ncbi:MAG: ATP-binding cassette domain-containing protein [Streptosporangiales bacterium]|nr:ATP-binding cassette domain-containing protein [Streptosporangiales bacterium]